MFNANINKKQNHEQLNQTIFPIKKVEELSIAEYDPDKVPANYEIAKNHGNANRVYNSQELLENEKPNNQSQSKYQRCPCPCRNIIVPEEYQLSLCIPAMDLQFMGPGFPLYYNFLEGYSQQLKILTIIFAQKLTNKIIKMFAIKLIFQNIAQEINKINNQNLRLRVGSILWFRFLLQWCYNSQEGWHSVVSAQIIDKNLNSPSDYTIKITNLPKGKQSITKDQLKQLIFDYWKKCHSKYDRISNRPSINLDQENNIQQSFYDRRSNLLSFYQNDPKIYQIIFAYDIKDFLKLENDKINLFQQIQKIKKRIGTEEQQAEDQQNVLVLQAQIDKIINKQQEIENLAENNELANCGVVFVVFESQFVAKKFYDKYDVTTWQKIKIWIKRKFNKQVQAEKFMIYENKILDVERAPEPNDSIIILLYIITFLVVWDQLGLPETTKYKKRIITNFYTFLILIASFAIILGINFIKKKVTNHYSGKSDQNQALAKFYYYTLSFISIFLIFILLYNDLESTFFIINFPFCQIRNLGNCNKFKYKHISQINFCNNNNCQKFIIIKAQFLNTSIIILLVAIFIDKNYFGPGGLLVDVSSMFLANSFASSFVNIFDVWYFKRLNKRKKIKSNKANGFTQIQANQVFEGSTPNMYYKYSNVLKIIWFTSFYYSVLPFGTIIAMIGIFIMYWVYKYNLLRREKMPQAIGAQLNQAMLDLLDNVPLLIGLGGLIIGILVFEDTARIIVPNLITTIIGSLNFIIPCRIVNNKIFAKKDIENCNIEKYQDEKINFFAEYDRCNPLTSRKASEEYQQFLIKLENESAIRKNVAQYEKQKSMIFQKQNLNQQFQNQFNNYQQLMRSQLIIGYNRPFPIQQQQFQNQQINDPQIQQSQFALMKENKQNIIQDPKFQIKIVEEIDLEQKDDEDLEPKKIKNNNL